MMMLIKMASSSFYQFWGKYRNHDAPETHARMVYYYKEPLDWKI